MDNFILRLSPSATRDMDRLEDKVVGMILEGLPVLKNNPFPRGKQSKKMKGKKSIFYRLRVDKYRVFYSIEGKEVVILRIIARKDADRFIKNLGSRRIRRRKRGSITPYEQLERRGPTGRNSPVKYSAIFDPRSATNSD